MKRLFWDIETSPNVVLTWRVGFKLNINADNILTERKIICIGYKWEDDPETHVLQWTRGQCDQGMLRKFAKVAREADELVAHNGDHFDLPWFKTRCLFHGIATHPNYKTIDTLQWARRRFYFNSNRMDYIAKYLGLGGKIKTTFELWKKVVLENDNMALERMLEYCRKDVQLLEQVYKRLMPTQAPKSHVGVMDGGDKWQCPYCGSKDVRNDRMIVTQHGTRQHRMHCMKAGHWYTVSEKAHRDHVEFRKKTRYA